MKRVKRKADDPCFLPQTHHCRILNQLLCRAQSDGSRLCHSHGRLKGCPIHIHYIRQRCPCLPSNWRKRLVQTLILVLQDSSTIIFWCWEANKYAQMPPLSVSNQDPVLARLYIPLSRLRRIPTAAVKHSNFVANLASAIFTISCTDFSDHHQLLVSTPAVGSMTAGPGSDWRAHLRCCPWRAEPKHKRHSQEAIVRLCTL